MEDQDGQALVRKIAMAAATGRITLTAREQVRALPVLILFNEQHQTPSFAQLRERFGRPPEEEQPLVFWSKELFRACQRRELEARELFSGLLHEFVVWVELKIRFLDIFEELDEEGEVGDSLV